MTGYILLDKNLDHLNYLGRFDSNPNTVFYFRRAKDAREAMPKFPGAKRIRAVYCSKVELNDCEEIWDRELKSLAEGVRFNN